MGTDEASCSADDAATLQEEAYSGKYPPFPVGRGEESEELSGAGADEGAEQEEACETDEEAGLTSCFSFTISTVISSRILYLGVSKYSSMDLPNLCA